MPVTFQQPEPMAPAIQEAGGAAMQWTHDMPSLARLYEAAAANATHANIAGAQIGAQAAAAHAATVERATAASDAMQEHQREFEASRQASPRDQFEMAAKMQMQQQHAETQAWLNQQDLSQAEGMRLQRMQNAVGQVMSDPTLGDEEKSNLITQLRTGIDPLRQRLESSKAKMENEQMQKMMHANAQMSAMENMDEAGRAAEFEKRVIRRRDGSEWMLDPTGKPHPLNELANQMLGKGSKTSNPEEKGFLSENQWQQHYHTTEKQVLEQLQAEIESRKNAEGEGGGVLSVDSLPGRVADAMERRGMGRSYSDYRSRFNKREEQQQGGGSQEPIPNTMTVQPNGVPAPPPTENDLKAMQPFDRTKPETMAPEQKRLMTHYGRIHDEIRQRRDLPEKQRWAAEDAMTDIMDLLERHGSYQRMTPELKAKFDAAEKVAAKVPRDPYASTGNLNPGLGVGGY